METIIKSSMESISFLTNFYETQSQYIIRKTKKELKTHQLGFLLDMYLTILGTGTEDDKKTNMFKNLELLAKSYIEIEEIKEEVISFKFIDQKVRDKIDIAVSSENYRKSAVMPVMHIENTIIMLITRFEEFISHFIRYIYIKYPQKYLNDKTICFSELLESNTKSDINIDLIREKIVDREVDAIMRKSYECWFDFFKEHNLNLNFLQKEMVFLKEIYATRNILVHNSGFVNDQYLLNVQNSIYKLGERVRISDDFVKRSFECIKTIILCVMLEAIRLDKREKDSVSKAIFDYAYQELSLNNYHCCETVFCALQNSQFTNELYKQMSKVNYWLSKSELYGLESIRTEIENYDISALDQTFVFAKHLLLCQYGEATTVLEEIIEMQKTPLSQFESWPLFRKYKETCEYKDFKDRHPDLTTLASFELNDEASISNEETNKSVNAELNDIKGNSNDQL